MQIVPDNGEVEPSPALTAALLASTPAVGASWVVVRPVYSTLSHARAALPDRPALSYCVLLQTGAKQGALWARRVQSAAHRSPLPQEAATRSSPAEPLLSTDAHRPQLAYSSRGKGAPRKPATPVSLPTQLQSPPRALTRSARAQRPRRPRRHRPARRGLPPRSAEGRLVPLRAQGRLRLGSCPFCSGTGPELLFPSG